MARNASEMLRRNVVSAGIAVALPMILALGFLGFLLFRHYQDAWGYGFVAILVAMVVQHPYLKMCDRYIFK